MKIEIGKVYEVVEGWGCSFQHIGTKVRAIELLDNGRYIKVERVDNRIIGTCCIDKLKEIDTLLLPVGTKVKIAKDILGVEKYTGKVLTISSANETFARAEIQVTPHCLFSLAVNPFYLENGYVEVFEDWSEWKWDEKRCIEYRVKGDCIQARDGKIRVQAKCMPCDTFSLEKGLDICTARIDIKDAQDEIKKKKYELEMLCR